MAIYVFPIFDRKEKKIDFNKLPKYKVRFRRFNERLQKNYNVKNVIRVTSIADILKFKRETLIFICGTANEMEKGPK